MTVAIGDRTSALGDQGEPGFGKIAMRPTGCGGIERMTGFDHDFAVSEPAGPLLRRWLRRMRRIWPDFVIGVGDEILATARVPPRDFTGRLSNGFLVSRDYGMQKHSDEHGFVPDETGQSSISVWIVRNRDTDCHVDLVLPERAPNAFACLVLREFFMAIALGYQATLVRDRDSGARLLSLDHPMAPDWSAHTLAACRRLRTGDGIGRDLETWSEASSGRQDGTLLQTRFGPAATGRDIRFGAYLLAEVVGCWHTIKYGDMKQRVACACPPGRTVIRDGRIDFGGPGSVYPLCPIGV